MRTLKSFLMVTLLLMFSLAAIAGSTKGVGMVLDVRGAVTALGHDSPLDITDTLPPGTRISIPKEGEVSFVFYPTRTLYIALGPAVLELDEKSVKVVSGPAPKTKNLPEEQTQVAQGYVARVVPAALVMKAIPRHSQPPRAVFPRNGETVLSERPAFCWQAAIPDTPLNFELREGERLIYTVAANENPLVLPEGVSLQPGHSYQWSVVAKAEGGPMTSADFAVATVIQRERLQRKAPAAGASPADWVLYAVALEQVGAMTDARQVWQRISQQRPESEAVKSLGN